MEENAGTPQIERLSAAFAACAKILTAIGDETRQHLIPEMMRMGDCRSVRVGKITEKANLSRLLFASSFALVLSLYHFRTRRREYWVFIKDSPEIIKCDITFVFKNGTEVKIGA